MALSFLSEERVWSVSDLNRALRATLESGFGSLLLSGEVTNWTRARSGHCYFTLKDAESQIRCVIWKAQAARLPIDPEEGTPVRVRGMVSYYEVRGETQFVARELMADEGDGLWKLAFERLRVRMEAEGLLDPSRKRPIPRFPASLGVVTSATGAAFHDILSVLARRAPWTRVVLRGTRVQGEGASLEIAEAIRVLAHSGEVDVLIVGRGGGSVEDLWAFNEEPVLRAIVASPIPVISAVGHEVDVTLSDLVADLRAPTPSAAAEAAVPERTALLASLQSSRGRLARGLRGQVERRRLRWSMGERRLERSLQRLLLPTRARLERLQPRLLEGVRGRLTRGRQRLATLAAQLDALSPLATLSRGYGVARTPQGKVLQRIEDFRPHASFELRLLDGTVDAEVRQIRALSPILPPPDPSQP